MARVLVMDPALRSMFDLIRAGLPDVSIDYVTGLDSDELAERGAVTEILVKAFNPLSGERLALLPKVRFIQLAGVGTDPVDLDYCREHRIQVAYNPGANAIGVAEHTVMLMLALIKQMIAGDQATRANQFPTGQTIARGIGDLAGATVGLIGIGPIAQAVATRVRAFDAQVMYTGRTRTEVGIESRLGVEWVDFDNLLRQSDIVSMHLALANETRGTMDARAFGLMKPGAYFVNTARGGLVDEVALRTAIVSGHLGGAGLDVIEQERDGGNPFADLDRVIMTPHIGGGSRGSFAAMADRSVANIRRYLNGEPLLNEISILG